MDAANDAFRYLSTLAAIVEAGNFSRAADELGVNRAAISKRILQIEAALGTPVFSRSTRKMELTPAGRVLLDCYRRASETLDNGIEEARGTMTIAAGKVSVSCSTSLATHVVGPLLHEFGTQFPKIRIHLQSPADEPERDDADIQLRITDRPPADSAVRKLAHVTWTLCASEDYLHRYGVPERPEDLRAHKFIMPQSYQRMSTFEHRETGAHESLVPQVSLSSNIQEAIFGLVQRGAGIGLLPNYLLAFQANQRLLRSLLPEWQLLGRPPETLYAIHAPAKLLRASTRAVLDYLAARVASLGMQGTNAANGAQA
jgi:DNA-binding transcriptional LysR family regulator